MNEIIEVKNKEITSFWNKLKKFFIFVYEEGIKFPAYILIHPLKGFDMFKRERKAKTSIGVAFIFVLIIVRVLEAQLSGFVVNQSDVNEFNTSLEIAYIIAPILLFTVANWSATSFLDGKGKMDEIFLMVCYSLFPLIFAKLIGIVLSNVIILSEAGLYSLVLGLGVFLMIYMIFFGLISIHEYGLLRCIGAILLTFVAILIIAFIAILAYDLFQKIYGFVYTVYREISLRYM